YNRTIQDRNHKDNFSHYGYVGKFTSTRVNVFDQFASTVEIVDENGNVVDTITGMMSNPNTVNYAYEPGEINPVLANYTAAYYDVFGNNPEAVKDRETVQGGGGLLNGDFPLS